MSIPPSVLPVTGAVPFHCCVIKNQDEIYKKTNKVFSQNGGQINFFKEKKNFNIKTIKFDKKFIKFFNGFKNKNLVKENKNYIENFGSIFFEVF